MEMWWALVLLGIAAGILSGMLGVGSGIVLVPALLLLLFIPQKSAQGTALAVMIPMALLGFYRYYQNPGIKIDFMMVILITAGSLLGTLIGTEFAFRAPAHVLRKIFAVYLLIVALRMFFDFSGSKPPNAGLSGEQDNSGRRMGRETG